MVDTNQTTDQDVLDPVDDGTRQRRSSAPSSGVTIDVKPDPQPETRAASEQDAAHSVETTGMASETVSGVSSALGDGEKSSSTGGGAPGKSGTGGSGSGGSGSGGSGYGGGTGSSSGAASDGAGRDYQRSLFIRLLYMVGYGVLAWMLFGLVLFLALLQFIVGLLNKELNEELRSFTRRAIVYLTDLLAFVAFIKEDKPFPLGKFPE
ncbi:MAG: DUF4389 domain-containing protein [Alphaproteobacteria bacterium]